MKRREFLLSLGGAIGGTLAAQAQQPEPQRQIGVLMDLAEKDPEGRS
jgi:hypothetical protein